MPRQILIFVAAFGAGCILGFFAPRMDFLKANELATFPLTDQEDIPFINQVVLVGLDKHFIINFKPLKEEFVRIQKKYPQATYVYFDYLNNASWVGLQEREDFTAASTAKVPLAMALYKAFEEDRLKPSDTYNLRPEDLDPEFGSLYEKGVEASLTATELVQAMLERSDNTAKNAIIHLLEDAGVEKPFGKVYEFFGWTSEFGESSNFSKINLKTLSNMFIALYNAKYLSVRHSQETLSYLSKTPFTDKIVAGLPGNIAVAHKVGNADREGTYSDCGIVYVPHRHYILCVGSSGAVESKANSFVTEISKAAYEYVIAN